ncbi:MAG: M48 family metallopeptidase [Candidatus Krumholzibacteriia bacterium]
MLSMRVGFATLRFPIRPVASLGLVLLSAVAGSSARPALARSNDRSLTVCTRDGQSESLVLDKYDGDHLIFKLKAGKEKREIALRQIARLEFACVDSDSIDMVVADSLDAVSLLDGGRVMGVLRRLDSRRTRVFVGGQRDSTAEIDNDAIASISFGRDVLDVDRHEDGKGFNLVGDDLEIALASSFAEELAASSPALSDTFVANYVDALGQRIARVSKRPDLAYSFTVIDTRQCNAFTPGGGKVFVNRGLIEQMGSEAELAGVLAHEIGHVVGRHSATSITNSLIMQGIVAGGSELLGGGNAKRREAIKQAGGAVACLRQLKYSRDDEREADFLAIYNLYQLGYDPRAMVSVFETLRRAAGGDPTKFDVYFQSHPSNAERIENTNAELPKLALDNLRLDDPSFQVVREHLATLPYPLLREDLASEKVLVPSGSYKVYPFKLTPAARHEVALMGHFIASGGSGNDIRLLVFDTTNFLNWKNNHEARALYESGPVTAADLSLPITTQGDYFLVLDNTFSFMSDKTVASEIYVQYRE